MLLTSLGETSGWITSLLVLWPRSNAHPRSVEKLFESVKALEALGAVDLWRFWERERCSIPKTPRLLATNQLKAKISSAKEE